MEHESTSTIETIESTLMLTNVEPVSTEIVNKKETPKGKTKVIRIIIPSMEKWMRLSFNPQKIINELKKYKEPVSYIKLVASMYLFEETCTICHSSKNDALPNKCRGVWENKRPDGFIEMRNVKGGNHLFKRKDCTTAFFETLKQMVAENHIKRIGNPIKNDSDYKNSRYSL